MNYWHLLLDIPAVVGGSSMLSLLSPWRMQARAVPALLFAVGLIVLALPMTIVTAMALMLPVAWVQRRLGIELSGHEPVNVAPAVELARSATQAARARMQKPKPVEVTEFVTQPYPGPGDAAELAHADAADDLGDVSTGSTEQSPAEQIRERLDEIMRDPRLPAGADTRLLGQRPGRDTSIGLRNQRAHDHVSDDLGHRLRGVFAGRHGNIVALFAMPTPISAR